MAVAMGRDDDRARLREIVGTVGREIARLRAAVARQERATCTGGLFASRTALVEALAVGSAPELRACPRCHHLLMRAATRCGHCWRELLPLPPPAGAVATLPPIA